MGDGTRAERRIAMLSRRGVLIRQPMDYWASLDCLGQGMHLTDVIQKAPPVASGVARAARLCSSSHRPHVNPRLLPRLPLQLPHSCTCPTLHFQPFTQNITHFRGYRLPSGHTKPKSTFSAVHPEYNCIFVGVGYLKTPLILDML